MHPVLRTLYAAAADLAATAANIAPTGHGKTVAAIRARRGIRGRYAAWSAAQRQPDRPLLWVHAPSVGEGLMARPVLTKLRDRRPDLQLAYTFFSPSAEAFARKLDVDFRDYLPFDTVGDTDAALDALQPRALVFSKLDVWPELVRQAKSRGVPVGLISATMSEGSTRGGRFARALLGDAYAALDAVGAIDDADAARLVLLGVRREVIVVTGDTRYDQVLQRVADLDRSSPILSRLHDGRPTLVAGSTWPADEAPLLQAVTRVRGRFAGFRVVIAPHEPTAAHLDPIERWARTNALSLARVDDATAGIADVVVVDRVGLLADLYAIGDVAFVGGGFHAAGLHSVVEPAAFALPVLFGPQHRDSRDAMLLLRARAARAVADAAALERALVEWFERPADRWDAGSRAAEVVAHGRGAAERSAQLVERLLRG